MATVTKTLPERPLFMQAISGDPPIDYDADDFRNLNDAIWASPGVITPTSFMVEQADTVGWAIKIRPGHAVVGGYLITSYHAVTLDLSPLNLNPIGLRTHRVWLVVQDALNQGDAGTYTAQLKVTEDFGSGAAVPGEQTLASAVLLLGAFTISPGQNGVRTANISAKPRNASHCGDFLNLADGTLSSGIISAHTAADTAPARVRYGAGRVWFSGSIKRSTGVFGDGTTVLGDLPRYLWPQYPVVMDGTTSGSSGYRLSVSDSGVLTATVPGGNTPTYLYLDGMSYEVD